MNNIFMIVGRISEINEIIDRNLLEMKISVQSNIKNVDGEYETDLITSFVYQEMAKHFNKYCSVGDLIGVKGRIKVNNNKQELIAEKITFLASKRNEEE